MDLSDDHINDLIITKEVVNKILDEVLNDVPPRIVKNIVVSLLITFILHQDKEDQLPFLSEIMRAIRRIITDEQLETYIDGEI